MINNEYGRSMVEMLGVLAIIGVLSVAGIAGYSMAMKKYKTNEYLNAASQLVILAQAKKALDPTKNTADLATDLGGANVAGVTSMTADCSSTPCTVTSDDAKKDPGAWADAVTATAGNDKLYNVS